MYTCRRVTLIYHWLRGSTAILSDRLCVWNVWNLVSFCSYVGLQGFVFPLKIFQSCSTHFHLFPWFLHKDASVGCHFPTELVIYLWFVLTGYFVHIWYQFGFLRLNFGFRKFRLFGTPRFFLLLSFFDPYPLLKEQSHVKLRSCTA